MRSLKNLPQQRKNKEEYLANLLRTRKKYDLLENVLPQSYDVEESATNSGEFPWQTKKTPRINEYRPGDSFEQFETVVAR